MTNTQTSINVLDRTFALYMYYYLLIYQYKRQPNSLYHLSLSRLSLLWIMYQSCFLPYRSMSVSVMQRSNGQERLYIADNTITCSGSSPRQCQLSELNRKRHCPNKKRIPQMFCDQQPSMTDIIMTFFQNTKKVVVIVLQNT